MIEQGLEAVVLDGGIGARPVHLVAAAGLEAFLATLPAATAGFLRDQDFTAASGKLVLLPGDAGVAGAVLGLGDGRDVYATGGLAGSLPAGIWRLAGQVDPAAVLAFCLGSYRWRPGAASMAQLAVGAGFEPALDQARAIFMVRDLINRPANLLGPVELADFAVALAAHFGARASRVNGEVLAREYPAIAAVGAGSARPAQMVSFEWRGSAAPADAPLIALCGKGVCFDTGGYDLKPSSAMLKMKKDMGGAAVALGLARLIMQADLPVRLAVWLGCVENSVSGHAMRPSDVIKTRAGLTVEIGNTDAEGRLVLGDLLAAACAQRPDVLLDFATLTGAARVALGPDIPVVLCNDDALAGHLIRAGEEVSDPLWRLPLWNGYRDWLKSSVADLNTVSSKPMAGAIVAGLYLQNFITDGTRWAHFDCYCWNDQTRPGRPEGGEATGLQAIWRAIQTGVGRGFGVFG